MKFACLGFIGRAFAVIAFFLAQQPVSIAVTIEPYSLFADPSGITDNAANTRDSGTDLNEVIEYSRLVDSNGVTACDKFFGWNGIPKVQTEEQKILCGKYQFFYEHWGTAGIPTAFLSFATEWFPKFTGEEWQNLGFFPDSNPRRLVTGMHMKAAGSCSEWDNDACVSTYEEDTYFEEYTMGEDNLPVGLVTSPKQFAKLPTAALTCASCHFSRTPDGRYAVGLANHNQNYGYVIMGAFAPLQASVGGVLEGLGLMNPLTKIPTLGEFISVMKMHPNNIYNDPTTEFAMFGWGAKYQNAMADLKVGTCYYRDPALSDLITCEAGHIGLGDEANKDRGQATLKRMTQRYGQVYTKEWPSAFRELMGEDMYCLPSPQKPSQFGGDDSRPWSNYDKGSTARQTTQNKREACDGVRWDNNYKWSVMGLLMGMLPALPDLIFGSGIGITMTNQDQFYRLDLGTQDFLTFPLAEDGAWTVSRIPSLFSIPSQETLLADYPDLRTQDGTPTAMLGHLGALVRAENFAGAFITFGGSVDPRYVSCETEGILLDQNALPDETCTVDFKYTAPLEAYLASLKAPAPLGALAPADVVNHGRQLFSEHCESCHNGPAGMSQGVFMFGDEEGLVSVPDCALQQYSVDYPADANGMTLPVPNNCKPAYEPGYAQGIPAALGFINTDATYARIFGPDAFEGKTSVAGITTLDGVTQGVKAARLSGARYASVFMHDGQIESLDELLCREGTARETIAQRNAVECMYYDLNSKKGFDAYKAGHGVCAHGWKPHSGHNFGCDDLSEQEKGDLIQYIKTL